MGDPRVAILMGSDSDLPVMRGAADVLREFGVAYEVHIVSAHRSPDRVGELAAAARASGVGVIIAGAGMAAHLAGAVAAQTSLPVIGVPLRSRAGGLRGADALLSTAQMPPGVPVATVAIDGAKNAGYLALRILALADPTLAAKLDAFRARMAAEVVEKDRRLQDLGIDDYLGADR